MSWLFDQRAAIERLQLYFIANGARARDFGNRVYQTFEATTFAAVIAWYRKNGWDTTIVNPLLAGQRRFRLKYSTRGDPSNFTYVSCAKGPNTVQIRHQIRVETFYNRSDGKRTPRANVVCDVAVLRAGYYDHLRGQMHVYNDDLVTFAEAKHMDAYAELIAGFIGLVHELQPKRLRQGKVAVLPRWVGHPKPFLHVSGVCMRPAEGMKATIRRRRMDIAVHDANDPFV